MDDAVNAGLIWTSSNNYFQTMIIFACFSPHPPILLPGLGSEEDKKMVGKTTAGLELLAEKLKDKQPDKILISSPHLDWGFNVPLHFLAAGFKGEVEKRLIGSEEPELYFAEGEKAFKRLSGNEKYGLIASGDLSHRLKEDGPYGFHPQGPKFDKALIDCLEKRKVKEFLELSRDYPQAGECGLRSFSFLLGILTASKISWQAEIISYQSPFGVGYLVANFILAGKD
jgi:aromatic ring-opening dioxygenase LigB subunit